MTEHFPGREEIEPVRVVNLRAAMARKSERQKAGFEDKDEYPETSEAHRWPWDFVFDNIEVDAMDREVQA